MDSQEDEYKKHDLESMYHFYLKRMKLDERLMSPTQRIERKRAWYCGFSMGLLSVLSDAPDTDNEFDAAMNSMMEQVASYLEKSIDDANQLENSNFR